MRRRASLNDNVGDRIFEENNNNARSPSLSSSFSSNVRARDGDDKAEIDLGAGAQQVLDCLDWQINLLNETKRINQYQDAERNSKRNFITTNRDPIATAPEVAAEAQLKHWSRRHSDLGSSNSSRSRKLSLDRYLQRNLKSAGECGCHFKHNNHSNENLHGESSGGRSDHFGKFESYIAGSSRQNCYLVEESSHLSATDANPSDDGTTLHANNRSLVEPPFERQQQQQQQNLPKLKPTTSAKQHSHGLLIGESGEDCTSGAVAAAGGGRRCEVPAAGKPRPSATGRSQSASRQGLTEAADLQFYGNKSANFEPSLIWQRSLVTCKTNHSSSLDCAINRVVGYEWDCEEEFESEVGSALAGLHDDEDIREKEENNTKSAPVLYKKISSPSAPCQCQTTHCSLTDSSTFSLSWAQDNPLSDLEFNLNSNLTISETAANIRLEGVPPRDSNISGRSHLDNKRTDSKLTRKPNDDDEKSPVAGSASSSNFELGHYNCSYSRDGFQAASSLSINKYLEIVVDAGSSNNNNRSINYNAQYRSLSVEQQQLCEGCKRGNYIHHHHNSTDSSKLTGRRIKRNRKQRKRSALIVAAEVPSESGTESLSHSSSLLSSSDNNNEEEEKLRGGKRKRRSRPIGKAEKSMKAAKDIAKLSIPSLSSLQYLPSQFDVSTRKNLQGRRRRGNNRSNKMAPRITPSNEINPKNLTHVVVGTESCENIHHEHQGLFSRLCLSCNCATKASDLQQNEKTGQDNVSKKKKKSKKFAPDCHLNENNCSDSLNPHQKLPSKSGKLRSLNSSSSAETTPSKGESIAARKRQATTDKQQFNKPIEKQSPSFLNILKSSSIGEQLESPTVDTHQNRRFATHRDVISRIADEDEVEEEEGEDLDSELELDLASGNRRNDYSNESRSNSLTLGPQSSSVERQLQQQSSTSCDSPPPTLNDLSSKPSRPQSVCSDQETAKRGSTLRRYLTPTRFFSTSSSPKGGLSSYHDANLDKRRISSPTAELRKDLSESFFTRSLNRFSGRKKKERKQQTTNVYGNLTTNCLDKSPSSDNYLKNQSNCASPTISNISSLHNDSLTSLDQDVDLPPFPQVSPIKQKSSKPVLLAPEIVLSRVKYSTNLSNKSKSDTRQPMGRPNNNDHHNQIHLSDFELDSDHDYSYLVNNGHQLPRYSSDIGYADFSTSDGSSERALSLPSSPYIVRRQRSPTASSRSPRLTHSPVPFQSPVTSSTKIEDGLQVCSSEHFEKHIGNIKGDQLEAQKKLFKTWINHYCPHLIQHDLVDELKDGIKLIGLLASLTRDKKLLIHYEKLNRDKQSLINRLAVTPTSRLRHLSNVTIATDYMRKQVGMKLVNLNPMDVVSGRPNVILGLCWNIILHFQLEQNFLRYLDSCETISISSSIEAYRSTSRLSAGSTNEDSVATTKRPLKELPGDPLEEFTFNDLVKARKKLLEHINKRFNLKLTHLTSSLLDGDVLLVIMKHLLRPDGQLPKHFDGNVWAKKSNDDKLDACFELAQERLNVPCLFSASDLRRQSISDNASKPLLVYLSMLLSANRSVTLNIQEELVPPIESKDQQYHSREVLIRGCLDEVDRPDAFSLSNLQSTLVKIKKLEELLASHKNDIENVPSLDAMLVADCGRVASEAKRVETVISWINRADSLFDKSHKSASDLNKALEEYKDFFSPQNVPNITQLSLCSTLELQYRECLNTAKQRVLLMEQTLKNWAGYERAQRHLKDWMTTAESKLAEALQPMQSIPEAFMYNPMQHHKACLEDLIEYFELEPIDSILANELHTQYHQNDSSLFQNDESLSNFGSVLSLVSNSSRLSLQSSKKATYYGLFDDFELKCRLLATQLDADRKEALLLGVKELKHRLRYITEQRVPQVVNELRFNIVRTEMFIKDDQQQITPSTEELNDDDELDNPSDCIQSSENNDEEFAESFSPSPNVEQLNEELLNTSDINSIGQIKNDDASDLTEEIQVKKVELVTKAQKSHKSERESKPLCQQQQTLCEPKPSVSWSLLNWLFASENDERLMVAKQAKSTKRNRRLLKSQKSRALKNPSRSTSKKTQANTSDKGASEEVENIESETIPFARMFWSKLIRASKASMSLNIVLLICLAGVCVVPLINKDACCELSQPHISTDEFISMHEKPT